MIIGTAATVRSVREQLAHVAEPQVVHGCVMIGSERGPEGLPALGGVEELGAIAEKFRPRMAIVSLPAAMRDAIVRVSAALRRAGIEERFVPTLGDVLTEGTEGASEQRTKGTRTWAASGPAIDLAELIGREPYELDVASVRRILEGKRVLITGAGGSIGSELVRVAAGFAPSQMVLMERAENALFEIDRFMGEHFAGVARKAVLHDVVDAEGTRRLMDQLRPHVVLHAAAHKHVPLMEDHPAHAVTNNLFGTKAIADAAAEAGAERFVMISTDKAVNPTSVMGGTKRLAELYVRWLAGNGAANARMSMVRFGNVLGSACSVLTIWSAQLAEGGPLTVTDPRMTRYFMTIPEAATLVIQSAALDSLASGGVYVLDMGAPVRIIDLAVRFARAHGLAARVRSETAAEPADVPVFCGPGPGVAAVDVLFTGARPG
ncbi:MAG TPA: polysaccharide biosynthesis protein, partial [Dongiaceae bacterium]|nr:polysaccharide biosynthesis protein [Dongiaceae bacterium]